VRETIDCSMDSIRHNARYWYFRGEEVDRYAPESWGDHFETVVPGTYGVVLLDTFCSHGAGVRP
jgi:hypothetical protein